MHEQDVRWEQRFSNYIRAFDKLEEAVTYLMTSKEKEIISEEDEFVFDMLKESLIQRFEYTHELAWNVMKDYAHYQGNAGVGGSRDATREAFSLGLIENGKIWMDMIISRNQTSHTYDEETANKIYNKVMEDYYPAFLAFRNVMEAKKSELQ
ncbi:MAG: nucleotidyltransferase substrate binding protein [Bacteroidetes bacterium]|nr:nucleotidyltransferase substrate binding protein [Bacteroidota bacterium]